MAITDEKAEAFSQTLEWQAGERPEGRHSLAEGANARPILTVMPDFGSGPFLWINRDGESYPGIGGNCCASMFRCGNHPMSDVLLDAFSKWISEFETAPWTAGSLVDPDDMKSGYQMILNWHDFHTRGLALAKRLKDEVGALFRVVYVKPAEDPAHHEDERREVLNDGSVVLLPSRISARASAAGCED